MNDVDHEVGSIRYLVASPLSSKVAMFNNVANRHQESQLLNPFSQVDGRRSPKPTFSKDEYGKPVAGSLTELRGQKANIHVCKEMLELCQVINSEGFPQEDEPDLKVILFGDLFNIYTHISDKVVGLLLRARKYKFIYFEGEVLFQRRDDDVPIFMLKTIAEIKTELDNRQEEFRRSVSPAPRPTTLIQDNLNNQGRSREPTPSKQDKSDSEKKPAQTQDNLNNSSQPEVNSTTVLNQDNSKSEEKETIKIAKELTPENVAQEVNEPKEVRTSVQDSGENKSEEPTIKVEEEAKNQSKAPEALIATTNKPKDEEPITQENSEVKPKEVAPVPVQNNLPEESKQPPIVFEGKSNAEAPALAQDSEPIETTKVIEENSVNELQQITTDNQDNSTVTTDNQDNSNSEQQI